MLTLYSVSFRKCYSSVSLLWPSHRFMTPAEIGSIMMEAISDPKTRRTVENAITRGLWDQIDDLRPVVEELEEEMEDYNEARSCWLLSPPSDGLRI